MDRRIFFSKPNHDLLSKTGQSMVDMHFHTRFSDANVKVQDVLKKAKKLGIGVSITDHNEIEGSLRAFKNEMGVMVIPGIEVSCIEGPHILLYFYNIEELEEFFENYLKKKRNGNPYMATKTTVEDLLEHTKKFNCIKVAAHPFGYLTSNSGLQKCIKKAYVNPKVMNDIDGIEVINGAMSRRLNMKAVSFSNMMQKMITAGTDGHSLMHLGNIVTSTPKAENHEEFLDNLRFDRNIVVGKEMVKITKLVDASKVIKTHWIDYTIPSVKIMSGHFYNRAKHMKIKMAKSIKNGAVRLQGKL